MPEKEGRNRRVRREGNLGEEIVRTGESSIQERQERVKQEGRLIKVKNFGTQERWNKRSVLWFLDERLPRKKDLKGRKKTTYSVWGDIYKA